MDVNETYCGGHFTVSTNAGSLHYKPETNVTCQFYLNRKKKNITHLKIGKGTE